MGVYTLRYTNVLQLVALWLPWQQVTSNPGFHCYDRLFSVRYTLKQEKFLSMWFDLIPLNKEICHSRVHVCR